MLLPPHYHNGTFDNREFGERNTWVPKRNSKNLDRKGEQE
jgi:hypothetical protein